MSESPKRIDPRRPFEITPAGLKRIVLGEAGTADAHAPAPIRHEAVPKPRRLAGDPDGFVLVVAHGDRGALDAHAHQAIAAAAILAGPLTAVMVLVFGELRQDLAPFGADRIIIVPQAGDGAFLPDLELSVLDDLVDRLEPSHIFLPDNATGDGDLGRRFAAWRDMDVAAHVVELRADSVAAAWSGGARTARRDLPRLILLDADAVSLDLPFLGAGEAIDYAAHAVAPGAYVDLGIEAIDAASLPLEEADFIVAAGNGVADVPTVEAVAKAFGAAIGASRVAVDDGRFPRDKQIGATGKTVQASVYLAVGISGAVQHLQGIRACRHVIAINTDASAPIARRADLTIVADAQAVMQQLLAETSRRNAPAMPEER